MIDICLKICGVCLGIIIVFGLLGFIAKKIGDSRQRGSKNNGSSV